MVRRDILIRVHPSLKKLIDDETLLERERLKVRIGRDIKLSHIEVSKIIADEYKKIRKKKGLWEL